MAKPITLNSVVPSLPESNFESGKYYHYYDADSVSATPNKYQQILASAEKEITIWDPYFDLNNFVNLFDYVSNDELKVFIVTTAKGKSENTMEQLVERLKKKLKTECKLNNFFIKILMRKVDNYDVVRGTPKEPHDRFLIIDKSAVYLVGASTGNHLSPDKSHGICELQDIDDINLVIKKYNEYINRLNSKNSYNKTYTEK